MFERVKSRVPFDSFKTLGVIWNRSEGSSWRRREEDEKQGGEHDRNVEPKAFHTCHSSDPNMWQVCVQCSWVRLIEPRNGSWAQKRRVRYWCAWWNTKSRVTSLVMSPFCILPGAPRACADFCDPTAVSRLNIPIPDILDWRKPLEIQKAYLIESVKTAGKLRKKLGKEAKETRSQALGYTITCG